MTGAERKKKVPQTGVHFRQEKEMHPAEEKHTVSVAQPKNRTRQGDPTVLSCVSLALKEQREKDSEAEEASAK